MEITKGNHSHYIDVQHAFCRSDFFFLVFLVMAREVKEVITELFMDRDSEEEPDENDNDFDSSFVPETVPEE